MDLTRKLLTLLLAAAMVLPTGCNWRSKKTFEACIPPGIYEQAATDIDYPAESPCTSASGDESLGSPQPWTINTEGTPNYWDLTLEEAIQLTLANSQVLRDVGGAVVRAPDATRTTMGPSIVETDPRTGVEAALSEFDAQFLTSTFWEKNHRALNNEFFGGGTRNLFQDAGVFQAAVTKRAVTGSQFWIRHNVDYDANNSPGNAFDSAWNTNVETEIRHPLMQGSGVEFNRIAGLSTTPGFYNGVLLARLNTDVALNDFEIAVRDLVSNVESAYWDLYYGYRVLDAKIQARDAALDTWRKIYALYEVDRRGGEADKEAQAREQFFRFQADVQNAMSGEPYEQTRNWNGQPGGAFRTTGGVLLAERRLRFLMGLPPSDGRLARPKDEPVLAQVSFNWEQVRDEATTRRSELRKQKWQIRRRELELIASKNYLLPRLDAVGRYRWRGFGDDLFPEQPIPPPPNERYDNAYGNLTSGEFQEWQLGFELTMPIGFRQAHVGVRNAELLLARERAILRDQQRDVVHEAADAIAEMDRGYTVMQTSFNRVVASRDQVNAVQAAYDEDKAPLDLLLEAQRRRAEAEIEYNLNRSRYAVALKNVHFVKGTLLEYDGVYLAEGPWCKDAYHDAAERETSRSKPVPLNYASSKSPAVSRGPYAQLQGQHDVIPGETMGTGLEEPLPLETPAGIQGPIVPAPISQPPAIQPSTTPPESVLPTPPMSLEDNGSATVDPTTDVSPARYDESAKAVNAAAAGYAPPLRLPPPAAAK
jgi:outer membrane protein TolC